MWVADCICTACESTACMGLASACSRFHNPEPIGSALIGTSSRQGLSRVKILPTMFHLDRWQYPWPSICGPIEEPFRGPTEKLIDLC